MTTFRNLNVYIKSKELETVIEKADKLGAMIMGLRKRHLENQLSNIENRNYIWQEKLI